MPSIFGPKNRRYYLMQEQRHDESRAFRTDTLLLRDAIAEYERHLDVSITPFVAEPGSRFLEPGRFVEYRDNDPNASHHTSGLCVTVITSANDENGGREIGHDFDQRLQPDDRVDFDFVAC